MNRVAYMKTKKADGGRFGAPGFFFDAFSFFATLLSAFAFFVALQQHQTKNKHINFINHHKQSDIRTPKDDEE